MSLIEDNSLDPNSLEQTRTRVETFGQQDHRKHNPGSLLLELAIPIQNGLIAYFMDQNQNLQFGLRIRIVDFL